MSFFARKISLNGGKPGTGGVSAEFQAAERARIQKRQKIVVTSCLAFSVVYIAIFWLNQMFCTPVELYHRVWLLTGKYFFDDQRVYQAKWKALEHKYDGEIKNQADAEKAIEKTLKTLDDPFTSFFNARSTSRQADASDGFYSGVGMVMNSKVHPISVRQVMAGSPAQTAGVKIGDEILTIDGLDCNRMEAVKIGEHTREHMYEKVHFGMRRAGRMMEMIMVPSRIPVAATHTKVLAGQVGYERIEGFVRKDLLKIVAGDFAKLKDCRALILDLRGNSGGSVDLCLEVAATMLPAGHMVSLKSRNADGSFLTSKYVLTADQLLIKDRKNDGPEIVAIRKRRANFWGDKPAVVLIDGDSASAAEMVAAALGENQRAVLVGERTYGKGIAQLYFPMPMATRLSVTAGRYYTPSGLWLGDGKELTEAERETPAGKLRGINPRYFVKAAKGLEYGKDNDNQLQFALDLLNAKVPEKKP